MPDAPIVSTFAWMLQAFAPCFTAPSMESFATLMAGWVLDLRRHTVTQVVRAAGAVGLKHISSYHRFFSRGRWTTDAVGLTLADLIVTHLSPTGDVRLIVDDTLGRHTGKRIAAASMHRDPLLSVGRRLFFHWGHVWVVLVVVRDFPGHERDDVFVSTDPTLSARTIIESFAMRWSLEVTFHEAKGKLGFEDPQNRAERAVERTAPLAFVSYSLTVLWYVLQGQHCRAAKLPTLPWYTHKAGITFSDMLATLRRASWRQRLLDPDSTIADLRKHLRPLVDYVASAA